MQSAACACVYAVVCSVRQAAQCPIVCGAEVWGPVRVCAGRPELVIRAVEAAAAAAAAGLFAILTAELLNRCWHAAELSGVQTLFVCNYTLTKASLFQRSS
jgi:hypothetical protein